MLRHIDACAVRSPAWLDRPDRANVFTIAIHLKGRQSWAAMLEARRPGMLRSVSLKEQRCKFSLTGFSRSVIVLW